MTKRYWRREEGQDKEDEIAFVLLPSHFPTLPCSIDSSGSPLVEQRSQSSGLSVPTMPLLAECCICERSHSWLSLKVILEVCLGNEHSKAYCRSQNSGIVNEREDPFSFLFPSGNLPIKPNSKGSKFCDVSLPEASTPPQHLYVLRWNGPSRL